MRWSIGVCSVLMLGIASQTISAAVQTEQDDDIVVTGKVPKIEAGLWSFKQHPRIPLDNYRNRRIYPGSTYKLCIVDGYINDVLGNIFLGKDGDRNYGRCSVRNIRAIGERISGRSVCDFGRMAIEKNFNGVASGDSLDIRSQDEMSGIGSGSMTFTTRLTAKRVGDCEQ